MNVLIPPPAGAGLCFAEQGYTFSSIEVGTKP